MCKIKKSINFEDEISKQFFGGENKLSSLKMAIINLDKLLKIEKKQKKKTIVKKLLKAKE